MKTRLKFHKSQDEVWFTDIYPGINGPTMCTITKGTVKVSFSGFDDGYVVKIFKGKDSNEFAYDLKLIKAKSRVKELLRSQGISFYDEVRKKRQKKK